jgi:predicted dehydrogenase
MIKAGIIGLGVGEQHIEGYQSHPGCEVAAICDINAEKLKAVGQKHPKIRATAKAEEILKDPSIQVVSIASYDDVHCAQILQALESGKHVFVEKPLVQTSAEAQKIRQALRKNPSLKLSSNLILRKYPRFMEIKKRLDQGALGKPYYLEGDYDYGRLHKIANGWRAEIPYYSVMAGGGIHMVDLLLWYIGEKVTQVTALGNRISSEQTPGSKFRFNDLCVALLQFEGGAVAKISANFGCVFPHFHGLQVYGTSGTLKNDFKCAYLYTSRESSVEPTVIDTPYPGVQKGDFIREFIDSILGKKSGAVSTDEVFASLSVCLAIEEAMNKKSMVAVTQY